MTAGTVWARAARAVVTLGLVALLIHLADPRRVSVLVRQAHLAPLFAALLVTMADRVVMVVKWHPLLRVQAPHVALLRAGRAYLASGIAHYILPASLGADLLRAVALGRGRGAVVEIGASIVAERVLGVIASGVMSAVAVFLAARRGLPLVVIAPWALLAAGLGLAALLLPMSPSLIERFRELLRGRQWLRGLGYIERFTVAYAVYGRHVRTLAAVGALTLIEQLFPIAAVWLVARALGVEIGVELLIIVVPLAVFVSRLPISIGGLGVTEGAFVYLLGLAGVPPSAALAVALLSRLLEVLVNAGPALVFWRELVHARRYTG